MSDSQDKPVWPMAIFVLLSVWLISKLTTPPKQSVNSAYPTTGSKNAADQTDALIPLHPKLIPATSTTENPRECCHHKTPRWKILLEWGTFLAAVAAAIATGIYSRITHKTYTEVQTQTSAIQWTARAAQAQATLMRQQLVGTQAADVNLDDFRLGDTMQLHLTAMNNGHVTAQDVHITVDASQRRIMDDTPIGPTFHFEPSVRDIPAGRGFGSNWDLPWRLTEYEREQGSRFAPDWPGGRTFEIRAKATFKNGFDDKTIYRSVCKKWLPGYMITWKDSPNTAGGGTVYECSDFREQIKLILQQEKAAKNGAAHP